MKVPFVYIVSNKNRSATYIGVTSNLERRIFGHKTGTGSVEYKYGIQGHMIEEKRVVAAPNHPTRTFITGYDYDTWGRLNQLVYPDGETINHSYDSGGNLKAVSGDVAYVSHIGYDHFGQRTYVEYGNGTSTSYAYEPALRRLSAVSTTGKDGETSTTLLSNSYEYDYVGNITQLINTQGQVGSLGGQYKMQYGYDRLNRLKTATSVYGGLDENNPSQDIYHTSDLVMEYDNVHRITQKNQSHLIYDINQPGQSEERVNYENSYSYTGSQPHALTQVLNSLNTSQVQDFTYDLNGNRTSHTKWDGNKKMVWDENNMMKGILVNDVKLQHYIYDAGGNRIVKSTGELQEAIVDGETQYNEAFINNTTVYPNGYMTISASGRYTKHYYVGSERIMSRLMGMASVATGGSDGGARARQLSDIKYFSSEAGIPDIVMEDYNMVVEDCSQYTVGSEAYKQCQCEHDPANCESNVMYYFHSDQLGSTSFLTDAMGNPYQFLLYLPWGETMVEQKVADFSTPYQFNDEVLIRRKIDVEINLSGEPQIDFVEGWLIGC